MTTSAQWQRTLDAVLALAEDIARISPDCADRAMQIARLIRSIDPPARRAGADDLGPDGDVNDDWDDTDDDPDVGVGPLHRSRTRDRA